MPGRRARRSALLLPLSLALCGDGGSIDPRGCGPGPRDPTIRVDLACTLEARGAVVRTLDCGGTWERQPTQDSEWTLRFDSRLSGSIVRPMAVVVVTTPGTGQVGVAYALGAPAPANLRGIALAATVDGLGYRTDAYGVPVAALANILLTVTSVSPPAGTFEATLVPGALLPDGPVPGPEGTNVVLTGTFRAN